MWASSSKQFLKSHWALIFTSLVGWLPVVVLSFSKWPPALSFSVLVLLWGSNMFLFGYFPPFPSSFFCSLKRYFPYLNISLPFLLYSPSLPQRNVFLLNIVRSFSISCARKIFSSPNISFFSFSVFFLRQKKKSFSFFKYFPSQTGIQLPFYLI